MQFTHLYYHISWLYMLPLSILPWNTPQGCSAPSFVWLHHCLYPISNNQTYLFTWWTLQNHSSSAAGTPTPKTSPKAHRKTFDSSTHRRTSRRAHRRTHRRTHHTVKLMPTISIHVYFCCRIIASAHRRMHHRDTADSTKQSDPYFKQRGNASTSQRTCCAVERIVCLSASLK